MEPSTSIGPNPQDSLRIKKRKLQDAFQTLDDAVHRPDHGNQSALPPAPKRTRLSRSIYSTLEKYGIKSNSSKAGSLPLLSRSNTAPEIGPKTPHLTAILSRVAAKAKNAFTFNFNPESPSLLPASAEYRPSSLQAFLSRLETFKLSTYSNKPSSIDAVAASRCGWTNDGKDRLVCGFCNASWVVAGRDGMHRDAANALVEKQRQSLVDNHKSGCPWKTRQCDSSIYCVPLKTPTVMVKDLKAHATILDPIVGGVGIRHPLTPNQLLSLKKILTYESFRAQESSKDAMDVDQGKLEPSEASTLVSIFGWDLVPPISIGETRRVSTSASISASRTPSRAGTPSRTTSRRSSFSVPDSSPGLESKRPVFRLPTSLFTKRENAMLQCALCQRRIGLWAFTPRKTDEDNAFATPTKAPNSDVVDSSVTPTRPKKPLPQRQFDLLKEHRSYCPYVVKSTIVPSLASASDPKNVSSSNAHMRSTSSLSHHNIGNTSGAVEGWRAVLAVVLRYGMAQRHRTEYEVFGHNEAHGSDCERSPEVDNVKAMVAGVKEQGGRELMKYVKGLLA